MSNDIRRNRTENYFIEALCDIIRSEGMRSATIRKVAEKAGYNSATIYTYFSNFSHLLLKAHFRFEQELLERIKADIDGAKDSHSWSLAYITMAEYYLENPNIFECIFVASYEDAVPDELRAAHEEQSELIQFVHMFLQGIASQTGVQIQTITQIHQACLYLTVGTVLFNLKERFSQPKEEILNNLTIHVKLLIENQMAAEREG